MIRHIGVYYVGQPLNGPPDYLILLEQAVEKVRTGQWEFIKRKKAVLDREAHSARTRQDVDQNVPTSGATDASISCVETFVNALGDIEPRRPEVRRVRAKVRCWPFVGDTKAIRVGPSLQTT
jgi:hypothetical protein